MVKDYISTIAALSTESIQAIELKARNVLIHSLGNLNHPDSKQILLQHLDPRFNHPRLRRSAAKHLGSPTITRMKWIREVL